VPLSTHLIPAPPGVVLDGPVWLSAAHRLVVTITPPGKGTDAAYDHLYTLKLNGSSLTRLRLPAQPGCRLTSQSTAVALAGGQLAYLQECWGQEIPHRAKFIRTYDPRTAHIGYLRPYPVPVGAGYFALSPDLQRAVINNGRGLYERLLWLRRASLEPVALPFSRVGYPSWSPNGWTIALDAVPAGSKASARRVKTSTATSTCSTETVTYAVYWFAVSSTPACPHGRRTAAGSRSPFNRAMPTPASTSSTSRVGRSTSC
jgi:hypothetical protein